jgi:phosphatidylglycerophosphate synthase
MDSPITLQEKLSRLATAPNLLTALRIVMLPPLWLAALTGRGFWLGIGVFVAFLSDVFDGFVARWTGQTSPFGAQFDSLADNLLAPSALIWLVMLAPQVYREHPILCATAIVMYASAMSVAWLKFRRFGNLHLYSSKVAGVLMYLFAMVTFMRGRYNAPLFYLTATAHIVSSTEALLVELLHERVDEHMGSLLLARRQMSGQQEPR